MFNIRCGTSRQSRPPLTGAGIGSGVWNYFGPAATHSESQLWRRRDFFFTGLDMARMPAGPMAVAFQRLEGPGLRESLLQLGNAAPLLGTPSAQIVFLDERRVLVFSNIAVINVGELTRSAAGEISEDSRANLRFLVQHVSWESIRSLNWNDSNGLPAAW